MGAIVNNEQVAILKQLSKQYNELKDTVASIADKADEFEAAELSGLAFSAHMVSESLAAYAKELGKYIRRLKREAL